MSSTHADAMTAGFDRVLGIELVELEADRARAKIVIRNELKQPSGEIHGGVFAAVAERLAGAATARAVAAHGKAVDPLSNYTSFLRPIAGGALHASAVARHRGRTTWVWEIEFSDDHGRLCALARMTIAIRDASGG